MERIAAFKIQKGLAKGFMVFGVVFLLLGIGLAIKSEEGWVTIVYMMQGVLFFIIGYTNIRNRKYYIEWDENEIRSYLPNNKKVDSIVISDIKAVSIKLFEIELELEDEIKTLNLDNLQFEELKKIKTKFEEIKSRSQAYP